MSSRCAGVVAVLMVVVLLAGCGEDDGNSASPTLPPSTRTAEPTLASIETSFGEVVWSASIDDTTGAPGDPLTTLSNSAPRVNAAIHTELLPSGAQVRAHWTIDGDPLPQLEPEPVVVEVDRADAWISWSLTWTSEQPWPIGALGIVIDVNGEVKAQSEILITRDQTTEDG